MAFGPQSAKMFLDARATLLHYVWQVVDKGSGAALIDAALDPRVLRACRAFDELYSHQFEERGSARLLQLQKHVLANIARQASDGQSRDIETIEPHRNASKELAAFLGFIEAAAHEARRAFGTSRDDGCLQRMLALQAGFEYGRMGMLLDIFADKTARALGPDEALTPLFALASLLCHRDAELIGMYPRHRQAAEIFDATAGLVCQ